MKKKFIKAVVFGICFLCGGVVSAQYAETGTIPGESNDFGRSIAISGTRMVVGAISDSTEASNAGAVYVFERNGSSWQQTAKFSASDAFANQYFGYSVDIDGNRIVVGAYDPTNTNAAKGVYVYDWDGNNWNETKLGNIGNGYGNTVSISGNRVVVGEYTYLTYRGRVHLYEWNGSSWTESIIQASDGASGKMYGESVSIDGDRFIVGAYGEDEAGLDAGAAYLYEWNGSSWDETKYIPDAGSYRTQFGNSVHIEGDKFIVGGYYNDGSSYFNPGFAHLYEWNGSSWDKTVFTASDGQNGDQYGGNVFVTGDRVLIAASTEHAVYVYDWNGSSWDETKIPTSGDYFVFGESLGLYGEEVIIGLESYNSNQGAVLTYTYGGVPDPFCSASDISTLTNPLPDLIYWNWDGNSPYTSNTAGTAVAVLVAPAETVLTSAEITSIDGSAEPGMVYFDEETGDLYISDAGGNLQDPLNVTSNAVASPNASTAEVGEVYFNTTTGEVTVCETAGTLDTPSDPSLSCLTQ